MSKKIRLGDDVVTYCGRCKEERTHQVEAIDAGSRIERVVCRFCHSNHLYREQVRSAAGGAAAKRARKGGESPTANAAPSKPARAYSAQATYEKGEHIAHPKFGRGEVVGVRPGKIDVRFGRDVRTLLHAG